MMASALPAFAAFAACILPSKARPTVWPIPPAYAAAHPHPLFPDPWFLGLWFADGWFNKCLISVGNAEEGTVGTKLKEYAASIENAAQGLQRFDERARQLEGGAHRQAGAVTLTELRQGTRFNKLTAEQRALCKNLNLCTRCRSELGTGDACTHTAEIDQLMRALPKPTPLPTTPTSGG
ncbi:hypothetical protein RI054_32g125580 [Pseudoscourfieldia marina]